LFAGGSFPLPYSRGQFSLIRTGVAELAQYRFREVMSDTDLPAGARLVYYWMRTLAATDGYCYASRADLSERTGFCEIFVSMQITVLQKRGYVFREGVRGLGKSRKKYGIRELLLTLFAAGAIAGTDPNAAALASPAAGPPAFSYQDSEPDVPGEDRRARRRRRRRHDAAA
jgi:Helix-turn-helix domain